MFTYELSLHSDIGPHYALVKLRFREVQWFIKTTGIVSVVAKLGLNLGLLTPNPGFDEIIKAEKILCQCPKQAKVLKKGNVLSFVFYCTIFAK